MLFMAANNPHLDQTQETREILVTCGGCFRSYVVIVNGNTPIPDTKLAGVVCPNCKIKASNWSTIQGSSGGWFNATIMKRML